MPTIHPACIYRVHGKPVSYRRATHKSLKAYDRHREKKASFEE